MQILDGLCSLCLQLLSLVEEQALGQGRARVPAWQLLSQPVHGGKASSHSGGDQAGAQPCSLGELMIPEGPTNLGYFLVL